MEVVPQFDKIAGRMRSHFEEAKRAIEHRGLKGEANEQILRDFLDHYLLGTLDVSLGELVDSCGNRSRQVDVIVSDAFHTPVLYETANIRVLPAECVIAVIEVKAKLDRRELDRAFQHMQSIKALSKTAYYPQRGAVKYYHQLYGKTWEIWPTNYYVFAFDSIRLETLSQVLIDKQQAASLPEDMRIDCICVLDRGVICNQLADGTISALPEPGSHIVTANTQRSLLLFYMLICHRLHQARIIRPFNFSAYVPKLSDWV